MTERVFRKTTNFGDSEIHTNSRTKM
ncbi:TPA: hypothetical protein OG071_003181, partial [Listeria monocytogenes]|nr:hypothetical protein [Listeria monocytogenes]HCQ1089934.1 hypothetical protein [Listeria monocytogenes]HCQ1228321.1 hypothetical protein [Listeria monocytogenes]